jgi:hypothetical protein
MDLLTHDLIAQLVVRLLDRLKSLVLIVDGRPQYLDLSTGARESLVPLLDGPLQRHDLVLQGPDVSGHQPDLDIEGIVLAADKSDVLLEFFHTRQWRRKVPMGFGRLLLSFGCIFTRFGRSIPSLRHLLLKRHVDDA